MADLQAYVAYWNPTGADATTRRSRHMVVALRAAKSDIDAFAVHSTRLAEARALYGAGAMVVPASLVTIPVWADPGNVENGTPSNCWYNTTSGALVGSPIVLDAAEIRREAVAHANAALNHMLPIWTMNPDGSFTAVPMAKTGVLPNRWWNTRMWIMGPLACIDALLDDSQFAAAARGLVAYRSLVPPVADRIEFWYRIRAYFRWLAIGNDVPAFASDAASSTEWSGGTGTEDVHFLPTVTPESFSS